MAGCIMKTRVLGAVELNGLMGNLLYSVALYHVDF